MYTVYYIVNKHKTAGTKRWHNIGFVLLLFTIPSYPLFEVILSFELNLQHTRFLQILLKIGKIQRMGSTRPPSDTSIFVNFDRHL